MSESLVLVEKLVTPAKVAVVTFNRPKVMNALNDALAEELAGKLATLDADTVVVATQPPSRFQRLVQGNLSYLLGRLDSTGTWRWAKQVE